MNIFVKQSRTYFASHRQAGLSLVELMISLTIGLMLMMGITSLIVQQSSARNELEKSSREIENGRYAMQLLHDDIQLAGFYGEYALPSGTTYTTPDPCVTAGGLGWNSASIPVTVPVAIYGYPGGGANPTTCALESYKPFTAILVVRRTDTSTVEAPIAVAGTTYLQVSQCSSVTTPFVLGASGFTMQKKDCLKPAPLRRYIVRVYYVSSCDVCGTDSFPTLKVMEFADGNINSIPLVEGIDNMQFDYGIDNSGDGSPDNFTTTPALTDWVNVMAIRVNLLARNNEPTAGYTDAKKYNLSGITGVAPVGPLNDNFSRHAYSELTRAINPSGRRE